MFALKNLRSQVVEPCRPWEFTGRHLVPEWAILDKEKRTEWASNPNTDYQIYSPFEGLNSSCRVSEKNPPVRLHAIAADWDLCIGDQEMGLSVSRIKNPPNWLERTLSGHWRGLWLLERPIPIASIAFAQAICERLAEIFPLLEIPGLDKNALLTFSRYYTNGGKWMPIHNNLFPWDKTLAFLMQVAAKFGWENGTEGAIIELNAKVLERLKERHPRIVDWPGEFKFRTQGPSFFIEGSTSPKSALVAERGIYTWAAHADKPYYTWNELLGQNWVDGYEAERMGRSVMDIYFDDKTFFMFSKVTQTWMPESKEHIINELAVNRGLSMKKSGSKPSEVDGAINFIRHNARIAGAASFAFYPKGLMEWNGRRYLNTHTREVIAPADAAQWGPDGGFPWISSFLGQFFASPEQLPFFLSWLSRYYASCYKRQPRSGQTLFIAGPANAGKTFLNRGIIGRLMGGHSEAKKFLLGDTNFNSQLFEHGHWVIDDGSVGSSAVLHRYFSEMIKVITANRDMESVAKFGKPSQVAWQGRCGITCNNDAESLRILPRLDINILDKIMLFRAAPRTLPFPSEDAMEKILASELPFFARFLLDFVIPVECLDDDPRFGVKSFHDSSLVASANHTDSAFNEVLDYWMTEHFTTREPQADCWEGTTLELRQEILKDPSMQDTMRAFDLDDMKRRLTKLSSGGLFKIDILSADDKRMKFRICRDTHVPKQLTEAPAVAAAADSKFEK